MQSEKVFYGRSEETWADFKGQVVSYIKQHNFRSVCELGGGANPLLSENEILELKIKYYVIDISELELSKAPDSYKKIVANVAAPSFSIDAEYDFVFSKMLAEHVPDGRQFHKNVSSILGKNGMALHFFPTLLSLPFLINWIIPENIAELILKILKPRRNLYKHAKFPAYYSWCFGPTKKQISNLQNLGYKIVLYRGSFGHGYYRRVPAIYKLHLWFRNMLIRYPNPYLTSFALVVLEKNQTIQE